MFVLGERIPSLPMQVLVVRLGKDAQAKLEVLLLSRIPGRRSRLEKSGREKEGIGRNVCCQERRRAPWDDVSANYSSIRQSRYLQCIIKLPRKRLPPPVFQRPTSRRTPQAPQRKKVHVDDGRARRLW